MTDDTKSLCRTLATAFDSSARSGYETRHIDQPEGTQSTSDKKTD